MLRHSRAADASTSLRAHHQRWTSEPSSTATRAVVTGPHNTKTSTRHDKVAAADAAHQHTGTSKTTGVPGRYQKNRSSTLDRDTKTTLASKPSLSTTLQQIGNWARRSFRGHGGGGKDGGGRRPKSLNDYVMTEVSSGVVVERKLEKLPPAAASRDQSPVTTSSSGYASGGDGVCSRMHDDDFDDTDGRHLGRQMQRGASRGSRRYRRRASMYSGGGTDALRPPPTPADQATRPPLASAMTADKKCREDRLPVYENLPSEALAMRAESLPVSPTQCHTRFTQRLDTSCHGVQIDQEVDSHRKPIQAEGVIDTGNGLIDDYLLPAERSSFLSSSDASTLRRSGNRSSPVYVNGNLLMTSINQSSSWRQNDPAHRSRSRSLSSSRNRTLTGDQSTTFNFGAVQQRLLFTPSFVSQSPSPPEPDADADADADWDDRLSTLSLGCRRRPPISPDRRSTAQCPGGPRQSRSKSARRRLLFGSQAMTSADRRPEAVEECVWPLFRQTGSPPATISNVSTRNPPTRRSTGLFPRLGDKDESLYETISDVTSRSRLPIARVLAKGLEVDGEHVYDNIDDLHLPSAPAPTDIHQIPPPLPPPPLPARRPTAGLEMPLCRSDVVELDSNHVYTIADVLDSFEALVSHLPRAQKFINDLQTVAYLHQRRQMTAEQTVECDRGRHSAKDAEGRWTAAAAMNRSSANQQWIGGAASKSSAWRNGPDQRRQHYPAMYSADDSQPIVVEDYICSPGNQLSPERPRRAGNKISTDAAVTANPSRGDGFYVPMRPGSKPSASTKICCGGRGSSAPNGRPPSSVLAASDAPARKPKQPTNKTGKKTGRVSAALSCSITELDRCDDALDRDNAVGGRRSSRLFQMPPGYIDASSYMIHTDSQLPDDITRHQRSLSRSLMDGISQQPSRPISGNVANRRHNSRMTSSTFAVDTATGRRPVLPEMPSNHAATRRGHCAPRSASEDRQTGTGNSSRVRSPTAVGEADRPSKKSSRSSRVADQTTASGLSRSMMTAPTVSQHPTSSGASASSSTSFHELPPHCDSRRSSILQWTAASCSGREIFC